MGRGIARTQIFQGDEDRSDFVTRRAGLCRDGQGAVYAWALLPNHVHVRLRTGAAPLFQSMQTLRTGDVVKFNRRHERSGHLFQNRYQSILCEAAPYLLELTRSIHLNPVRGGILNRMREVRRYAWTGHAAILGVGARDGQDTATVLAYCGRTRRQAVQHYEECVREGIARGRRPELVGGGLMRSVGGWSQVVSLRRSGIQVAADQRILGTGDFPERRRAEAARRAKDTLRLSRRVVALPTLARQLTARTGIPAADWRAGIRRRDVVRARRLVCHLAVKGMG